MLPMLRNILKSEAKMTEIKFIKVDENWVYLDVRNYDNSGYCYLTEETKISLEDCNKVFDAIVDKRRPTMEADLLKALEQE